MILSRVFQGVAIGRNWVKSTWDLSDPFFLRHTNLQLSQHFQLKMKKKEIVKQSEAFYKQNKISRTSGAKKTDGRGITLINSVYGLGFALQQRKGGVRGKRCGRGVTGHRVKNVEVA